MSWIPSYHRFADQAAFEEAVLDPEVQALVLDPVGRLYAEPAVSHLEAVGIDTSTEPRVAFEGWHVNVLRRDGTPLPLAFEQTCIEAPLTPARVWA